VRNISARCCHHVPFCRDLVDEDPIRRAVGTQKSSWLKSAFFKLTVFRRMSLIQPTSQIRFPYRFPSIVRPIPSRKFDLKKMATPNPPLADKAGIRCAYGNLSDVVLKAALLHWLHALPDLPVPHRFCL
jgi:hypothetical protein